jgi:hypothetical protein
MTNDWQKIEQEIDRLKRALSQELADIEDIEALAGEKIQVELWGLNEKSLEKAMWDSFLQLERNKDCLAPEKITSHRKIIGAPIVLYKKILRAVLQPYTRTILNRQSRFNAELIQFQLATLLRLEKMRARIDAVEAAIQSETAEKKD